MTAIEPRPILVRMHHLTMVDEGDGVMIGRPDIGSYALFPRAGAEAIRMLDRGSSLTEIADWYEQVSGETLDVDDFVDVIDDLQFVVRDGEQAAVPTTVRWQRTGARLFSWPALLLYACLVIGAVVAVVRVPDLRPSYRSLFFTDHISLIPVVLLALGVPWLLVHESFHALAGRRLGLPTTLGIGRRLYFLVAETHLDALLSVPRRKRYLPFLAGMIADAVILSALTLASLGLRDAEAPHWCSALCLAAAFDCLIGVVWQLQLYLQTDLYYVAATAFGCADLQGVARHRIRRALARIRRAQLPPNDGWTEHDLAVARWYTPFLVAGYGFALGTLALVGIPTAVRFWTTVAHRLTDPHLGVGETVDTVVFIALALTQLSLLLYVAIRDRRRRRAARRNTAKEF
jgi:hypothetical protein